MQRDRRHDPSPFTWEVPAGIVVAVLLLLVLGVHAGRGVANMVAGGWWGFPEREHFFTSLPALLAGDAGAGLNTAGRPVAPRALLSGCIVIVETLMLAITIWAVRAGVTRWGPNRVRGVASRPEIERLLGRTRLRRHARIVRPDLYGTDRRRG